MASAIRVKGSTLRSLALVAPAEDLTEPSTWKLLEGRRPKGSAAAATIDGAGPVGELLRRRRRRRRVSLRQAAADTCIPARYIEALERDLPLDAFPGAVYARGFLKTYARYLKISDIEAVVHVFDEPPPPPVEAWSALTAVERRRGGRRYWLLLLIVTLISASISMMTGGTHRGASHRTAALGLVPAVGGKTEPDGPRKPAVATTKVTGLSLTVSVSGRSSWLQVSADGAIVFAGRVLPAGFRETFSAKRLLELTIGNAGAVRLLVGGVWSEPLGAPGMVRRIVVTLSDGAPIVRSSGSA